MTSRQEQLHGPRTLGTGRTSTSLGKRAECMRDPLLKSWKPTVCGQHQEKGCKQGNGVFG